MNPARDRRGLGWLGAATGAVALAGFAIEGHTRSQHPLAADDRVRRGPPRRGGDVDRRHRRARRGVPVRRRADRPRTDGRPVQQGGGRLGRRRRRRRRRHGLDRAALARRPRLDRVRPGPADEGGARRRRRRPRRLQQPPAGPRRQRRRRRRRPSRGDAWPASSRSSWCSCWPSSPSPPCSSAAPRSAAGQAAPAPATVPADAVELPLSNGAGTASVAVAPARAGSNEIRLLLLDAVRPAARPGRHPDRRAHRADAAARPAPTGRPRARRPATSTSSPTSPSPAAGS